MRIPNNGGNSAVLSRLRLQSVLVVVDGGRSDGGGEWRETIVVRR